MPGSNPVNYAGMVAQEATQFPDLSLEDIINSGVPIPVDPWFNRDDLTPEMLGFDPSTSPVPGGVEGLTPEQIAELAANFGFDPNDPVQMQEALIRLRLSSSPGLIGY